MRHSMLILTCALALNSLLAISTNAQSADTLLTISGQSALGDGTKPLTLTRDQLLSLKASSFETSTIWTDGVHRFDGVSLHTLASLLDLSSDTTLRATAINNYSVEIPLSDATPDGPIIAYAMDGADMSVRDKGPLWIVYPYDSRASYRAELIYARSIWQIDRIDIVQ